MIEDGKPVHWPKMIGGVQVGGEQAATKALADVRGLIIAYRKRADCEDWRTPHAKTAPIVDVVAGLIADAEAIDGLFKHADARVRPLEDQVAKLREELAESKRPFSAQMEMQNRRIIDLTAKLDAANAALNTRHAEGSTKP
jgi:hypothetical protein